MEQSHRVSREFLFPIIGMVLLLAAIGYTLLTIRFLVRSAEALTREPAPPPGMGARFNLEELEPLFGSGKLERITPTP